MDEWGKSHYIRLGLCYFFLGVVIFYIIGWIGWPGELDPVVSEDRCYCETLHTDEIIWQPYNTWSSLFIVIAGLVMLHKLDQYDSMPFRERNQNPMFYPNFYSISYCMVVLSIGITTIFFHGSMRAWANFLDIASMNMYIAFMLAYNITQLTQRSKVTFAFWFIGLNIGSIKILLDYPEYNLVFFTALVFIIAFMEIWILWAYKKKKPYAWFSRQISLFILGMTIFSAGTIVWLLANNGGMLCQPDAFLQGHVIWHFADALSFYVFYLYLRSQKHLRKRVFLKSHGFIDPTEIEKNSIEENITDDENITDYENNTNNEENISTKVPKSS